MPTPASAARERTMREVICADALPWLEGRRAVGAVVTGLPDAAEIGWPVERYLPWFRNAARLAMLAATPAAPAVFCQTDRKADGQWHSKAALLFQASGEAGLRCLWHKIVLRRATGATDLHRPGYSHVIAFSREGRPGAATPDVLGVGKTVYSNGMPLNVALAAVRFAAQSSDTICDPFCGRGTTLAVAEALGLRAVGVDIDPAQCAAARRLRLTPPATAAGPPA